MGEDPNLNALWSRVIAEELVRGGVEHAVLCPGSRNAPLLFALAAAFGPGAISHVDERSAGFLALGLAKTAHRPVAICITSGSALANLAPAVVEAAAAQVPLLILAADRPWELVGVGAPQAMVQPQLFAAHARELVLGEPVAQEAALTSLRTRISRLAQGGDAPVVIHVPLRDPLPPLPDPGFTPGPLAAAALHGRPDGAAFTRRVGVAELASHPALRPGLRGVIVCGAGSQAGAVAGALAQATGYPLLADAATGLRTSALPSLITTGDALVGCPGWEAPELIVQVGPMPLARAVVEWLGRHACPWLALEEGRSGDYLARAHLAAPATAALGAALAARLGRGDPRWSARWARAEAAARAALTAAMAEEPWGEVLAAHLACTHPGFAARHLASSMPVRHGNLHCGVGAGRIDANRGLNGIDGTLGSFLGERWLTPGPTLLLIGDLACLHDLPALAAAGQGPARGGAIVLLDNGGGGIFDFLPVSQVPGWERWVRTPQSVDLAAAAGACGLEATTVADRAALGTALERARQAERLQLIRAQVPGSCAPRHRALLQRLVAAGQEALNAVPYPG